MTARFTEEGARAIADVAARNGFSEAAALAFASALAAGNGTMAQFSHPELGGFGQWSEGGMLMIGDMFNSSLKSRVSSLADGLADLARQGLLTEERRAPGDFDGIRDSYGAWWPDDLGNPASSGAQNGQRYAIFPQKARLALERNGRVTIHDTGEHRIGGVSQQQGSSYSLNFSSQLGTVSAAELPEVDATAALTQSDRDAARPTDPDAAPARTATGEGTTIDTPARGAASGESEEGSGALPSGGGPADVTATIRKLAELRADGLLSDAEFETKKAELLARL